MLAWAAGQDEPAREIDVTVPEAPSATLVGGWTNDTLSLDEDRSRGVLNVHVRRSYALDVVGRFQYCRHLDCKCT